eukprot:GHVS01076021.1.p1 GENE.GHVS01076021.1~~GHVS01076021.1.p1  ORF type:complete len:1061 (-),score=140.30 GHVS01076021.1:177-3359(-)
MGEEGDDDLLLHLLDSVSQFEQRQQQQHTGEQESDAIALDSLFNPPDDISEADGGNLSGREKEEDGNGGGELVELWQGNPKIEVRRMGSQICMYENSEDGKRKRIKLPPDMLTKGHRIRRIMGEKLRLRFLHSSYNRLKLGGRGAVMNLMKEYIDRIFRVSPTSEGLEMLTAACCYISARKYDNVPVTVREIAAKLDCRQIPTRRTVTLLGKLISQMCSTLGIKSLPLDMNHDEMAARLLNKLRESLGTQLARQQVHGSGAPVASLIGAEGLAGSGCWLGGSTAGGSCERRRRKSFAQEEEVENFCIQEDVIGDMLKAIRDDAEGSTADSTDTVDSKCLVDLFGYVSRVGTNGTAEDTQQLLGDALKTTEDQLPTEQEAVPTVGSNDARRKRQRTNSETLFTDNAREEDADWLGLEDQPTDTPSRTDTGDGQSDGRVQTGASNGRSWLRRLPEVVEKLNDKDLSEAVVQVFSLLWRATHTPWAGELTKQLCPYWAAVVTDTNSSDTVEGRNAQETTGPAISTRSGEPSDLGQGRTDADVCGDETHDDETAATAAVASSSVSIVATSSKRKHKDIKTGVLQRRAKTPFRRAKPRRRLVPENLAERLGKNKDWVQKQSCAFGCEDPLAKEWRARGTCMYSEVSSLLLIILENFEVPLSRKQFGRILGVHATTMILHCGRMYMLLHKMFSLYHAEQCSQFAGCSTSASPYCSFLKTLDAYWKDTARRPRVKGSTKWLKKGNVNVGGVRGRHAADTVRRRSSRGREVTSTSPPASRYILADGLSGGVHLPDTLAEGCGGAADMRTCYTPCCPEDSVPQPQPERAEIISIASANLRPRSGRPMTPENSLLGDLSNPRLNTLFRHVAFLSKLRQFPTSSRCLCWVCRVADETTWIPSADGNASVDSVLYGGDHASLSGRSKSASSQAAEVLNGRCALRSKVEEGAVTSCFGVEDNKYQSRFPEGDPTVAASVAHEEVARFCSAGCDGGATCTLRYCSRSGSELRLRKAYTEFHLRAIIGQLAAPFAEGRRGDCVEEAIRGAAVKQFYSAHVGFLSRFCEFVSHVPL